MVVVHCALCMAHGDGDGDFSNDPDLLPPRFPVRRPASAVKSTAVPPTSTAHKAPSTPAHNRGVHTGMRSPPPTKKKLADAIH
jgi:hypothetical protein